MRAAGRKPNMSPKAGLWPDKIVEIVPEGKTGGQVVWEWHVWDHLVQNYDAKMANYGRPADHPELLDFGVGDTLAPLISKDTIEAEVAQGRRWRNETAENQGSEVYHFNAIKYNAELDQIAFSSPVLSEIFIIDHSTTTEEAAGHKGGRYGKGGDFLYRWGNPQNYHRGNSTNRQLYGQHDVRWIEKGYPGEGHLTIFNNALPGAGKNKDYSAVFELVPPIDKKGNYIIEKGKPYGPEKPAWKYIAADTLSFFAPFISGAQRMANGNTFINEGPQARFFEVTPQGKIVWEYFSPYRGEIRRPNGDPVPPMPMTYITFRANFIAANHPGLAGRQLSPGPPAQTFCITTATPPPSK